MGDEKTDCAECLGTGRIVDMGGAATACPKCRKIFMQRAETATHLLPPPGGEVARDFLGEVRRLEENLAKSATLTKAIGKELEECPEWGTWPCIEDCLTKGSCEALRSFLGIDDKRGDAQSIR